MGKAIDHPILGSLDWREDEDEAELVGVARTPSGLPVRVGVEVRRYEDDRRPPVGELLARAAELYAAMCEREGDIRAEAAGWLATIVRMEPAVVRERVQWARAFFFLDGYGQMVFDISALRWGRQSMFVDVGPGGRPIEGRIALI